MYKMGVQVLSVLDVLVFIVFMIGVILIAWLSFTNTRKIINKLHGKNNIDINKLGEMF